ncbi:nucleotide-sugar transporter-domain-containing protein [Russula earlei]|uniref:Nucleotide-sugar transporter-domain-containing protein n=1 Tax=Russula earlei TaxID=71964 RepID=A0ACC0UEV5_9AGAM|nr:nucleotide-sugar transporter-domain-containing protein [Russula earlei]
MEGSSEKLRYPHVSVSSVSVPAPTSFPDIHHRPFQTARAVTPSPAPSRVNSARTSPLIIPASFPALPGRSVAPDARVSREDATAPTVFGLPLKYVSLVTLAVQNAALSIVMHYSRVSTPPSQSYSPASAVLLNEILKGSISFGIALWRLSKSDVRRPLDQLLRDTFSPDCWKLSIPAVLYVVQNSASVTYQMKILTTAAFSVLLLRRRLTSTKWVSLFFLAAGVAIVQIQTGASTLAPHKPNMPVGSAHESAPLYTHIMSPLKGFGAVTAACFTSGLAGVYFEMVLKNSKADLWVRNVQLSLFSLVPALLPILYGPPVPNSRGFITDLLKNFGCWAWATVAIQVLGGLITAVVIKYSDNILKGFATSLSIILSFLASVILFNFRITPSFLIGSSTVLVATWLYNQPAGKEPTLLVNVVNTATGTKVNSWPGSPVESDAPILGQFHSESSSPVMLSEALGSEKLDAHFPPMMDTPRYLSAPYGSPFPSRTPSPSPPATARQPLERRR